MRRCQKDRTSAVCGLAGRLMRLPSPLDAVFVPSALANGGKSLPNAFPDGLGVSSHPCDSLPH